MAAMSEAARREWVQQVVARHEETLLRYARRLTGCGELARDAVQETLLRCWAEERWRSNGHAAAAEDWHLANWLFAVCRTRAIDLLRKERRMSQVAELAEDEGLRVPGTRGFRAGAAAGARRAVSRAVNPADAAETRDAAGAVLRVLETLPLRQQEVVVLKFQAHLSYAEIAAVTGLSVGNVGFLMHVALKAMRGKLGGLGIEGLSD